MKIDPHTLATLTTLSIEQAQHPENVLALISYLDLTSLNETDNEETIIRLCQQAQTPYGQVAAVCIWPKFIGLAADILKNTPVQIATVCNFPEGNQEPWRIYQEIEQAIHAGVHEIDLVIPYQAYVIGDSKSAIELIKTAKNWCGPTICLKVILETGYWKNTCLLYDASQTIIAAGADFIKTSTGKIAQGATPEAAWILLNAIKATNIDVGFKVAGGVKDIQSALLYHSMAAQILGYEWVTSHHFRIGASQLLTHILQQAEIFS